MCYDEVVFKIAKKLNLFFQEIEFNKFMTTQLKILNIFMKFQ